MELSTQGLVTDGVGEIKLLSPQPCQPIPGAFSSLSLSQPLFSLSLIQCFLATASYHPAPSFVLVVGRLKSLSLHPPVFFLPPRKSHDISKVISREKDIIQNNGGRKRDVNVLVI